MDILTSISNYLINDKIINKLDSKINIPDTSFYKIYLEHNMLIIIIILFILIGIIIRYFYYTTLNIKPAKNR
jgi:hypothetical protein